MSGIYSQASNFSDFVKTGVDERTGQFTVAIALPLPPANQLSGPSHNLSLAFSTLSSTVNRGYGLGWSLGLSELSLDQQNPRLSLASGEQFAIDLNASDLAVEGRLAFFDQKLKTLNVICQADGSMRVDKKTGDCEILAQQDPGSARYLLAQMRSPEGRRLYFDWLPFGDDDYFLQQVRDEQRVLMTLENDGGDLQFTLNPDTPASAVMQLLLSNDRLSSIRLPGIERAFEIEYDTVHMPDGAQWLLPSHVTSPLGAQDIVQWSAPNDGHRLAQGAPWARLPRVIAWVHSSGQKASELIHSYEWIGEHNYLGFGSDQAFEWHRGRDNLYQVANDYQYQVIETLTDGAGQPLGTYHRTWDRYHLLISETHRLGHCETRKRTTYAADPELTWAQQPACCQLPVEVSITYLDLAQPGASRSEITTYRYDDFGNVVYTQYPSGVQEHSEYYPAEGAEGCPPDPLGMVRHLKRKTITPAQAVGDAAVSSITYTYQPLANLAEGGNAHIVVASEQAFTGPDEHVLEATQYTYINAPGPHHGRVEATVVTLQGKSTTTAYDYQITEGQLVTSTSVIGYERNEENRSSTASAQWLINGQICWERSETGACNRYEYDLLGRLIRTLSAVDSPFQTERLTRYHLHDKTARQARGDSDRSPLMLEQVDVTGRRQRQWLDGEGRTLCVELEDLDNAPGTFREVSRSTFDALGRNIQETTLDWVGTPPAALVLSSTTRYDGWGKATCTTTPAGVQQHVRHNPITLQSEQWQTADGLPGPKQVTCYNTAGSPIEQQDFDNNGRLLRTLHLVRDGLDRIVEQRTAVTGAADVVTRYRYDPYSRVIEKQLPDATRLTWTFAPHSDDDHPQSLAVNGHVIGRQTFDGLGRQRTVEVAGRTTRYHYRANQLPPTANTLADGTSLAFTYEPNLGNAVVATTPGTGSAHTLSYHPTLGIPMAASNDHSSQQWHFTASGLAERDTWLVDGEQHTTHWQHSFNGLPLRFTDAAGVEHLRSLDAMGRLSVLQVGALTTTYAYDAFSRPATIVCDDPDNGRQLHQAFTYDAMGREHQRTFTLQRPGSAPFQSVQTLAYSDLDQLVARTWLGDGQRGEERFEYDLRGRLTRYTATPTSAPQDPFGNAIVEQRFDFNALDGYTQVVSVFADGSQDLATFTYSADDPTQLITIDHTHASWPARIDLQYDACGRVVADSLGRTLAWDSEGRLAQVQVQGRSCQYSYDPGGQLCERLLDGQLTRSFFSAGQLTHEQFGDAHLGLMNDGQALFAMSTLAAGVRRTTLLGCDAQGSVRLEAGDEIGIRNYTPHGAEPPGKAEYFGYAGERRDPLTGWLIPGGYRPYDPLLMTFLSPDSASPFGRGGINPYAYCGGNPIERTDPDGHSWQGWVVTGIGIALGVASLITTAPALATVIAGGWAAMTPNTLLAISTAVLNTTSVGTGAASAIMQACNAHEQTASVLGWVSLGTGIASAVLSIVPAAAKLACSLSNASGRSASKLTGFKPYKIGPGGDARPASILFAKSKNGSDVAFIPNLYGEGNAAFVTHGHPLGQLMNAQGQADDAVNVARNLIAPRLAEMGYPADQKLVLLTCWGGKSGAAQTLANELRRPVEGYSQALYIKNTAALQTARTQGATLAGMTNIPVYKASPLSRLLRGTPKVFRDKPNYGVAQSTLYLPQ